MQTLTSWNSSFSVGNELLDRQHQRLLAICSKVAALVTDDGPTVTEGFHDALHDLAEYTRIHFAAEEGLLLDCHYPDLHAHVAEHVDCLTRLSDFLFAATQGVIAKEQLHQFLASWWVDHVSNTDMRYRNHLQPVC